MKEIETYKDLLAALSVLTPEQLAQPIQVADPSPDCSKPVELQCGIALGTVGEFGFEGSRSVVDNKYHADDVVILVDGNPHAEDGATAYVWRSGGFETASYGVGGPTKREDQFAPKSDGDTPAYVGPVFRKRMKPFKAASGPTKGR